MTPGDVLTAWPWDPGVLVALIGVAAVYARSVARLWGTAGRRVGISPGRVGLFAGAMAALVVALVTPLDSLGGALFSAHMVQHLLLAVVAAPLLVAGRLPLALQPLIPVAWRRWVARRLPWALRPTAPTGMVVAVVLHVGVMLMWHVPGLYDLAVRTEPVHALEHLTLLAASMPFWAAMGVGRSRPVAPAGLAAFVASLTFILLAAGMSVSPHAWYASHLTTTAAWGLTPLQDQQLAAAILWIPGGLVYLGAATAAVIHWIRADERAHDLAATRR